MYTFQKIFEFTSQQLWKPFSLQNQTKTETSVSWTEQWSISNRYIALPRVPSSACQSGLKSKLTIPLGTPIAYSKARENGITVYLRVYKWWRNGIFFGCTRAGFTWCHLPFPPGWSSQLFQDRTTFQTQFPPHWIYHTSRTAGPRPFVERSRPVQSAVRKFTLL